MTIDSSPLISVVLPVYNVALYVKEAINSILEQTIQDFEIIIIDDCSTDNTIEVIETIKDYRLKIIKKNKNKGLVDSLNIGFDAAKGKYIARMDGDDICHKERFKKQLEILNNSEIKACGCWLQEFAGGNKIIKHSEHHEQIVAKLLLGCSMSLGSVMLERKWINNFRFDENKKHVEDYDFWSQVAWTGKFYNIQEVLYFYRVHQSQVSVLHTQMQKAKDVTIKIFLFKKLQFDEFKFKDNLLFKFFFQNESVTITEFGLFMSWLKEVRSCNKKLEIYNNYEFEKVIEIIKNQLLFKIYFQESNLEITKKWRFRALFKISTLDAIKIIKLKFKEKLKLWVRRIR
jgi:glycosyltransferase involved in cell wall biosynthesis